MRSVRVATAVFFIVFMVTFLLAGCRPEKQVTTSPSTGTAESSRDSVRTVQACATWKKSKSPSDCEGLKPGGSWRNVAAICSNKGSATVYKKRFLSLEKPGKKLSKGQCQRVGRGEIWYVEAGSKKA